jgi:hypothetical protein
MLSYQDILNLIKESDFTLIGYTHRDEIIKDELVSNFNYVEIEEINSSFSFKSFLRDLKLESLLENKSVKNPEYILLDINNIRFIDRDRLGLITFVVENLRSLLYTDYSGFPEKPQFKIILTSSLYRSAINSESQNINNFSGGSGPIYVSDLVLTIIDGKIKIIKNRFGNNGDEILYKVQENLTTFAE